MRHVTDLFVDSVSGKQVSLYKDSFGRAWLADNGPWSMFRVKSKASVYVGTEASNG